MPTRTEFEAAAELFNQASADVSVLAASVEATSSEHILFGGSLGQTVPERIASAGSMARRSQVRIDEAAQTCLERAAIIAAYEAELEAYDVAFAHYQVASMRWTVRFSLWLEDTTELVVHPGARPTPPRPPAPPPSWADVRHP
jgi:hypothetical protein